MNQAKGYIYVRNHPSYDEDDACKLGKANNIPERDGQYATGEIRRGYFEVIFEVPIENMGSIEHSLQDTFYELNIKYDAGTEFYNRKIITLIEPRLITLGIIYKKLSKEEIHDLVRCKRHKDTSPAYTPRTDQAIIIEKSIIHFIERDKGILVLICGIGKTLISLWIAQKLNSNTILIGVPNKLLLKQWRGVICELFKNIPYLTVSGGVRVEKIMKFLKDNKKCIIVTTYSSAHKVYTATASYPSFVFDMKILDEAHHLTTSNMKTEPAAKKYIQILPIPSVKQLSLTATLKQLGECDDGRIVVSNDNIEYFGEIIDRKCLLWAINENIICDYVIQTIIAEQPPHIIGDELFLSAWAAVKSISAGHSHHLLIYSNSKNNSLQLIRYIKMLLDDYDINLYYSDYHSEMKTKDQREIIDKFEKAPFGIITCVYCLGEGWDFPLLDGVVFAENMTSNIRIVQSALRASRKNKLQPDKITKIILPLSGWSEGNLKKVREVIYHMSLEDASITQKIKVFRCKIGKSKRAGKDGGKRDDDDDGDDEESEGDCKNNVDEGVGGKRDDNEDDGDGDDDEERDNDAEVNAVDDDLEYDEELTQKLILNTTTRIALDITYEQARKILAGKNIKSKESYYELCAGDNRLSKEPEIVFKRRFTSWIEYLSIERVYYDLETCKNKVTEYLRLYPEIYTNLNLPLVCNELCARDALFPPNGLWIEYYNIRDLRDIITIKVRKRVGVICS